MPEVVLEDIEERRHLREDEHLVPSRVELLEHAVHQGNFARRPHQNLAQNVSASTDRDNHSIRAINNRHDAGSCWHTL